jgi:hypothetical protein
MVELLVWIAILVMMIGSSIAIDEQKYGHSVLFGLGSIILTIIVCTSYTPFIKA